MLGRARSDAGWGQGFYSSNLSDPQYGDTAVQVAFRLRRPLLIEDPIRGAEQIDDLLARAGSEDIRATLVAAGYDGVVVQYKHLGRYVVVAYFEEQVKVVVEE